MKKEEILEKKEVEIKSDNSRATLLISKGTVRIEVSKDLITIKDVSEGLDIYELVYQRLVNKVKEVRSMYPKKSVKASYEFGTRRFVFETKKDSGLMEYWEEVNKRALLRKPRENDYDE